MTERSYRAGLIGLAAVFTALFFATVVPALAGDSWDFWGAAKDTFANPYAAGVSIDVLLAYVVLALWVIYEALAKQVTRGWIALVIGLVTGLTVALAVYLLIRMRQVAETASP